MYEIVRILGDSIFHFCVFVHIHIAHTPPVALAGYPSGGFRVPFCGQIFDCLCKSLISLWFVTDSSSLIACFGVFSGVVFTACTKSGDRCMNTPLQTYLSTQPNTLHEHTQKHLLPAQCRPKVHPGNHGAATGYTRQKCNRVLTILNAGTKYYTTPGNGAGQIGSYRHGLSTAAPRLFAFKI